jgi:hypothetical protein
VEADGRGWPIHVVKNKEEKGKEEERGNEDGSRRDTHGIRFR